jgi:hypothetical protein
VRFRLPLQRRPVPTRLVPAQQVPPRLAMTLRYIAPTRIIPDGSKAVFILAPPRY